MNIAFISRQSPDWASLAADYESGKRLDLYRYKPRHDIPGFPKHIEKWIGAWNRRFGLNFFRCRQILKETAMDLVARVPDSKLMSEADVSVRAYEIGQSESIVFYLDDDDWFDPDLQQRLTELDLDGIDVAVFPLVRLGREVFTFVRAGEAADIVIGERHDFDFRYQTNNYGIRAGRVPLEALPYLKDHVEGSGYADRIALTDGYFDRIVSATNKTPCSASGLPALFDRPDRTVSLIRGYVDGLRAVPIPDSLMWLNEPIDRTIGLFEELIDSARPLFNARVRGWLNRRLGE